MAHLLTITVILILLVAPYFLGKIIYYNNDIDDNKTDRILFRILVGFTSLNVLFILFVTLTKILPDFYWAIYNQLK